MQLNPIKNTPLRSVRMSLADYNVERTRWPVALERHLAEVGLTPDANLQIVVFENDDRDLEFITNE